MRKPIENKRTIYVDEDSWRNFQKQSIDIRKSVSARIRDFIKNELEATRQRKLPTHNEVKE